MSRNELTRLRVLIGLQRRQARGGSGQSLSAYGQSSIGISARPLLSQGQALGSRAETAGTITLIGLVLQLITGLSEPLPGKADGLHVTVRINTRPP